MALFAEDLKPNAFGIADFEIADGDTEGKVIAIAYCCFYKLSKLHGQGRIVNRFNDKGKRDCASLKAVFNRHSRNVCGRESNF
ncbi:hypothetical protein [Shewanella sp. DW31]|uniref:hypothetical protein n=1 Tax=Shewanella sp. DW31 TaxID=2699422 RepID=UPI0018E2B6D1|nr:hypothetical protein [Shewanella sp. DW31]MBI1673988.1 hypothetical protein [Shewanella sp. DW31]